MGRLTSPPPGPYKKWTDRFLEVSDRAFDLLCTAPRPEVDLGRPSSLRETIVYELTLDAETTSIAARTCLSYCLGTPAFALGRVRLEQCIVASYLVHTGDEEGIKPYLASPLLDKWKGINKKTLAEHRDARSDTVLPWRLEDEYKSFYAFASRAVHGAGTSAAQPAGQFHEPSFGAGGCYVYMNPKDARWVASTIARLDLVQCYEALACFGRADATELAALLEMYEKEAQRH